MLFGRKLRKNINIDLHGSWYDSPHTIAHVEVVVLSEMHGADGVHQQYVGPLWICLSCKSKDRPGRTGSQMIFQHITVIGIFLLIVVAMLVWSQELQMDGRK